MDRAKEIRSRRMALCVRRHEYWKAYQLDAPEVRRPAFNRDGTISRPRFAKVTPEQEARFEERERRRAAFDSAAHVAARIGLERKMGATLDFVDLPPDRQAMKAGRPVVRIVTLPGEGFEPEGFASGFLIGPGLILTNHHVFGSREEAANTGAQFLYERTPSGLRDGEIFRFDPARFFVTDRELD
jgi:endonuclease G